MLEEEDGYTFLDVRTKQEYEYRIAGSVNVPIITATWRFEKGKPAKVPDPQAANLDFVNQVQAKFPTKSTKLIICCSDGRTRTLSALRALDAAGYTHLVGMKNGACGHRPPPPSCDALPPCADAIHACALSLCRLQPLVSYV